MAMDFVDISPNLLDRGAKLHPGERFYLTDTGHYFRVIHIDDELASEHGREVKRLFATEVDASGNDLKRRNNKPAEDPHGYHLTIQAHDVLRAPVPGKDRPFGVRELPEEKVSKVGEQIDHVTYVKAEIGKYLEIMVRMSENHKQLASMDDLFVPSSKAHRIPGNLPHLRGEKDAYGQVKHK